MSNFSVAGADIGNITSIFSGDITGTTSELIIESRIEKYSNVKELGENEIFEIDGEKWVVNQGLFKNEHLKFEKDNFLQLLYYGLAKTCEHDRVKLVIGIPAGQFNEYHKQLKQFITDNNFKKIQIGVDEDQITRNILIEEVIVRPESYGIKNLKVINQCEKGVRTLIVDIGGGSTDVAIFDESMKFIDGESLDIGLLDLYKKVRRYISTKYCKISLEDTKKVFDGDMKMFNITDYKFKEEYLDDFMEEVINEFKGAFPDASACNIILAGGGERFGYKYFKQKYPQTIAVSDVQVNAKAFYMLGVAKWKIK